MTTTVPTAEQTTAGSTAARVVDHVRAGFDRGITRPLAWRIGQLDALETMLRNGTDQLTKALHADLGKSATEAWTTEIGFTLADIADTRSQLPKWVKPQRVSVPLGLHPAKAQIAAEPLGTVLILAPWNYPVQLVLSPMIAAIAAGNAVVAKPSEIAPATSAVLIDLAARYLDQEAIAVVGGGVPEATALLDQDFDHIFFTGSTKVGRIVAAAAADKLTPVTLELGGKSPAIVAADADLSVTANRIAWGKFLNAGQTCVAPDYVLVPTAQRDELVDHLATAIAEFYGSDPQMSSDYGRIVSDRHVARLEQLLHGDGAGTIAVGGNIDPQDRYVEPTVVVDSAPGSAIMSEEIFGPILPIIAVDRLEDAIQFVNDRPKPLALYIFANDESVIERCLGRTSSGGVSVNTTVMHLALPDLPFGGVGDSGMGAYHGKTGFDTFSHHKSVYKRAVKPDLSVMYPPYTKLKQLLLRRVI